MSRHAQGHLRYMTPSVPPSTSTLNHARLKKQTAPTTSPTGCV
ncbi:hypothetical protein SNOG_00404 [Parastagonospora nodorum SN15]|uniref:Uncharacterized protein n=1 Tax=Phaeosphaeria nodorum (strain SN15 / ATCC MYA-4574 / FGSC 10173) TaxID=321614 RepID=Q0V6G0_PHANO|nr:hypothetical protein SNOG_00404 [Parastagonospora nodorum SN15]EAT91899.1 hypothetical protein SNOG_00404 [Parastagonospora nodorum SN15]